MARSICKFVSIFRICLRFICILLLAHRASAGTGTNVNASGRSGILMSRPEITHYTETQYLSDQKDMVIASKLRIEALQLGPVRGYGGVVFEQDSRSTGDEIYNDNGISPMLGARVLLIPQIAFFSEYRHTFRMINRPDSRPSAQPDLLLGSYGYNYWPLSNLNRSTSFFQEAYGDLIARSKLSYEPALQTWSKTGARLKLDRAFSFDTYLDIQFRRSTGLEREDNFQAFGPGFRFNVQTRSLLGSISLHQENGSYKWGSDSISRWKTLFVISGAL